MAPLRIGKMPWRDLKKGSAIFSPTFLRVRHPVKMNGLPYMQNAVRSDVNRGLESNQLQSVVVIWVSLGLELICTMGMGLSRNVTSVLNTKHTRMFHTQTVRLCLESHYMSELEHVMFYTFPESYTFAPYSECWEIGVKPEINPRLSVLTATRKHNTKAMWHKTRYHLNLP